MKKLLSLLLAVMLLCAITFSIASCGGNTTPPDEPPIDEKPGENGGEKPDDGNDPVDENVYFTVTVRDEMDGPVSGVMVQMCEGEICLPKRTDENGKATYAVAKEDADLDYVAKLVSIPDGYDGDKDTYYEFDENNAVTLYVFKQPDGTAAHPFVITEDEMSFTVPEGGTLHFQIRGSSERYVVFGGEGFELNYADTAYTPEDGKVRLMFESESLYIPCEFTVTNKTDAEMTLTVKNEYVPGTSSAPYKVESMATHFTATVLNGSAVYYSWIADKAGVLAVTSDNIANNIFMYNTTSYVQSASTEGRAAEYVSVSVGDEVQINVSALFPENAAADASREITFSLAVYAATTDEPLPIVLSENAYRVGKSSSITFSAEAGKTVTVVGEGMSVSFAGETLTAGADGKITFTLTEAATAFTLTNTTDSNNDYTIAVI